MRWLACWVLGLILLTTSGCGQSTHYQIVLSEDGDGLSRELTVWNTVPRAIGEEVRRIPQEKIDQLAKVYPERLSEAKASRQSFRGSFRENLPNDVGGRGTYSRFTTSLGETMSYAERFRGQIDLAAQIEDRKQAVETIVDLVQGWLERELDDPREVERVREFLRGDFRNDLLNLSLYLWDKPRLSKLKPGDSVELGVRLATYLQERGYLEARDIATAISSFETEDKLALMKQLRQLLVKRLDLKDGSQDSPARLLSHPDRLEASWEAYLRSTPEFQRRLRRWQDRDRQDQAAAAPNPSDILFDAVFTAFPEANFFRPDDVLDLSLKLANPPFATNGTWQAASGEVTWSTTLKEDFGTPVMCYALWSHPNRKAQLDHFGGEILSDADLASYISWYIALSPELAKQWDTWLSSLQANEDLSARISQFHFQGGSQDENRDLERKADFVRQLLLRNLRKIRNDHGSQRD